MFLLNPTASATYPCSTSIFTFLYVSIKLPRTTGRIILDCNLHSTMFLLNLKFVDALLRQITFTFHYVSIKSESPRKLVTDFNITFHYVSIKSWGNGQERIDRLNLHSTMFLLNLNLGVNPKTKKEYLHSTMFLLNPIQSKYTIVHKTIYIPLCFY